MEGMRDRRGGLCVVKRTEGEVIQRGHEEKVKGGLQNT